MRTTYIIISFLLLVVSSKAQEEVYITFLQDSAAVGETVDLIISTEVQPELITEISLRQLEKMQFISASATLAPKDSITPEDADLNIVDMGLWNDKDKNGVLTGEEIQWETVDNNGQPVYRNGVRLAFFDVGIYMFNGFQLDYNGGRTRTNRALMKVTFKNYDLAVVDSTGLAPIKNIERESLKVQDFLPYFLYILVPLALLWIGYRVYKKRLEQDEVVIPEEVVVIPPDVKALTDLKDLRGRELWQQGAIKQYQSELSYIIREYLEGRYDIHALESTTSQIIRSIKDKSFTADDQEKLKRILQISDLVKFAKAKPEVNIHEEFMNDAVAFVQRTRKEEKAEEEE